MADLAVANQFAKALLEVAQRRGGVTGSEEVLEQVGWFVEMFHASRELRTALLSPAVEQQAKARVIERLCRSLGAGPAVRNFLYVVTRHRRLGQLDEIRARYQALLDESAGIERAQVSAAQPLSEGQRAALEAQLERVTGKQVRCGYVVDEGLVGGVSVKIGSTMYDGSVRGQLGRLRRRLAGAR